MCVRREWATGVGEGVGRAQLREGCVGQGSQAFRSDPPFPPPQLPLPPPQGRRHGALHAHAGPLVLDQADAWPWHLPVGGGGGPALFEAAPYSGSMPPLGSLAPTLSCACSPCSLLLHKYSAPLTAAAVVSVGGTVVNMS